MQPLDCGLSEPALSRLQCLVWDLYGVLMLPLLPSIMPETSKGGCHHLDFRSEMQHLAIQLLTSRQSLLFLSKAETEQGLNLVPTISSTDG